MSDNVQTEQEKPTQVEASDFDPLVMRERYNHISSALRLAEEQKKQAEEEVKKTANDIELLRAWKEELQAGICKRCDGKGKHWRHYAQDDCKLVTCEACGGTGFSA